MDLGLSVMGFKKFPDDFGGIKVPERIVFRQIRRKVFARPNMSPVLDQVKCHFSVVPANSPRFQMDAAFV